VYWLFVGLTPNACKCFASYLGFVEVMQTGAHHVVRWQSADGKRYTLSRATNLVSGFDVEVRTNILGIAPANTETDTMAAGSGPWSYRIELE